MDNKIVKKVVKANVTTFFIECNNEYFWWVVDTADIKGNDEDFVNTESTLGYSVGMFDTLEECIKDYEEEMANDIRQQSRILNHYRK